MCNIAGYIGYERAAPKLFEMMEKQEGLGGGFYTGIATIHQGKLYYRKVIGDVARLLDKTDAATLPGTMGIIHSRTKSGGDVEWGHPFVNEKENMAYIANGAGGFFEKIRNKDAIAQALSDAGHIFRSRTPGATGNYPRFSDGSSAHVSDVMCHLIESFILECGGPAEAMRKAFIEFPSEIVGLMIHTDTPDCIIASRINQPLMIGRDENSTYLATTAMAFPDLNWINPMPTTSTATIYQNSINILPFESIDYSVASIFPWEKSYNRVMTLLSNGSAKTLAELMKETNEFWPKNEVSQSAMMVYEILRHLKRSNKIRFLSSTVEGVDKDIDAPRTQAVLNRLR